MPLYNVTRDSVVFTTLLVRAFTLILFVPDLLSRVGFYDLKKYFRAVGKLITRF